MGMGWRGVLVGALVLLRVWRAAEAWDPPPLPSSVCVYPGG